MPRTEHVVSADGTDIGYLRDGEGRPLVMVHGSPATHTSFDLLLPHLSPSVGVCVLDRRGRGVSGDATPYAFEREFEDAAAVVDSIGEPADLFGHSFGGIVALEAAPLCAKLRRLVLYEPATGRYPAELLERLQGSDDPDEILVGLFRAGGLSDEDLEVLRAAPSWEARRAVAKVSVREAQAEDSYEFHPERFAALHVPTLLIVGDQSPPEMRKRAEMIADALPDARIEELRGQGHVANVDAPGLLARAILSFLT